MDRVVCTPHIGYVTRDEYEIQFADVFGQIAAYAEGRPINVVNHAVLEYSRPPADSVARVGPEEEACSRRGRRVRVRRPWHPRTGT